jgi:hypothetical protein
MWIFSSLGMIRNLIAFLWIWNSRIWFTPKCHVGWFILSKISLCTLCPNFSYNLQKRNPFCLYLCWNYLHYHRPCSLIWYRFLTSTNWWYPMILSKLKEVRNHLIIPLYPLFSWFFLFFFGCYNHHVSIMSKKKK